MLQCIVPNSESSKLYVIVLAITDIILLLIVLIGLLRLRRDGCGTFGIGLLLWKQVGSYRSMWPRLPRPIDMHSVYKGVIWLLLATVADVPPAVRSTSSIVFPLLSHHDVTSQVFIILNLNSIYRLLSIMSRMNAELLNHVVNIRSAQPRTFFACHYSITSRSCSDTYPPIPITDFSASVCGNYDHRCDADVSLSVGLCLRYHKHARLSLLQMLIQIICR